MSLSAASPNDNERLLNERFMRRALELANRAWGRTHPNPMVGAVIVEDGEIVSEGFHARDGGPHAERVALAALGRKPKPGATLYVTLEPCSTHGRTGACCEAIKAAGVTRVIAGATDPFAGHAGRGFALLRAAGVDVINGVLAAECEDLNLIFNHWITRSTPLIAAKMATTLDGKIATRTGESKWITGEAARADVMRWRRLFPAIAVGAGTVLADNPRLTARGLTASDETAEWCPWRFVFDSTLRTVGDAAKPTAMLYTDEFRDRTIVVTGEGADAARASALKERGVGVWSRTESSAQTLLEWFRQRCAQEKITGVYVEGGATLLSEFLRAGQVDYLFAYRAPVLLGDDEAKAAVGGLQVDALTGAIRLSDVHQAALGPDQLVRGRVLYPEIRA
jgi:diaminohydroxyphosphoribosylaminopyrimidine deaminase/5-amino-6-(5-phosphoribosylamino)uracil reductase